MKYSNGFWFAGSVALLFSTSALAAIDNVKTMKTGSGVTVVGTVDKVKNEREFTLRDESGKIDVNIASGNSVVLKPGDKVTVSGVIDKGFLGADINANTVSVNKNVTRAVGDMIEAHTGLSFEGATAYTIGSLPNSGMVKVSGIVTDVDNEKKFTVKDDTGSIKVDVASAETAELTEGAHVTVVGSVDKGFFSKDINASKVLVVSDASTSR